MKKIILSVVAALALTATVYAANKTVKGDCCGKDKVCCYKGSACCK
jgi:hypothetical protein